MNTNQIIFIITNIVGGIAVILTYIPIFKNKQLANTMWGGISKQIQKVYGISMLLSAISFITIFIYILTLMAIYPYYFHILEPIYILLFIASALWTPLTKKYILKENKKLWIYIRIVLAAVGLSSLGILYVLLNIGDTNILYYLAAISGYILTVHTAVLDAIAWPYYWKKPKAN